MSGSGAPPRGSLPPQGIALEKVSELLDRLAGADEAAFVVSWVESLMNGQARLDPRLSVRLLRAYREVGRIDKARELASELPSSPASWGEVEFARLAIERAMLATIDGRGEDAEAELHRASRALASAARGAGLREQLDMHLAGVELELRRSRTQKAERALRLAEHVAGQLDDGAWRVAVSISFGHLAMRLADPGGAAAHYQKALDRAPSRGHAAMRAHGNCAIALGSTGHVNEAREHARAACSIAARLAAGWRHADAYDALAIVEIAADRPAQAIEALDAAFALLGDLEQPTLRCQLSSHKTFALAALGRGQAAMTWMARTERLRAELAAVDAIDEQDLVATRARSLEATSRPKEALDLGLPHAEGLPGAFVTGTLNLVLGRSALALGKSALARTCVERAALSGDAHGWIFPERAASAALYQLGRGSGDSRVVRYAERMLGIAPPAAGGRDPRHGPLPSAPSESNLSDGAPSSGEPLAYVTTSEGVIRLRAADRAGAVGSASLVVDTITHHLKVDGREISLERRRALEPLLVQLLRRAREGLSAEEILRAAGGPGPGSADAEHRVRVLISRVRDLLGDPAAIERVRDAGEHGKTRYRLAPALRFALVEPG